MNKNNRLLRDQEIIRLYKGGKTQKAIGELLDLTTVRINQILGENLIRRKDGGEHISRLERKEKLRDEAARVQVRELREKAEQIEASIGKDIEPKTGLYTEPV